MKTIFGSKKKSLNTYNLILLFIITISITMFLPLSVRAKESKTPVQPSKPKTLTKKTLSNQLPTLLMEELSQKNLWSPDKDEAESADSIELALFLKYLTNKSNLKLAVDSMIQSNNSPVVNNNYLIKVSILRYFLANPQGRSNPIDSNYLTQIEQEWMKRYISSSLTLISQARITDYQTIIESFADKLKRNEIKVIDLSPKNRQDYHQKLGASHGVSLNDFKENKYLVNGFYSSSHKIFALDFSRPFFETMVTFAHEIVHAADPKLTNYNAAYKNLFPQVLDIIKKIVPNQVKDQVNQFAEAFLPLVFFELEAPQGVNAMVDQAIKTIQALEKTMSDSSYTRADRDVITQWVRALIGVSVENEYKAYGLSLLVYYHFSKKMHLLEPSAERDNFIKRFKEGDDIFVNSLANSMNPFSKYKVNWNSFVNKFRLDKEEKNKVANSIMLFQQIYLQELSLFIQSLKNKFVDQLNQIDQTAVSQNHLKVTISNYNQNSWSNPKNIESQANRFSLITARVTTMWVLRVKENIKTLIGDISALKQSLLVLRAGILDFQNLNSAEMSLLGIINKESQISGRNDCSQQYTARSYVNYDHYAQYMNDNIETSTSLANASDPTMSYREILEKLLKVRLIQGLAWLDQSMPEIKNHTMGAQVFFEKLDRGFYDKEDLSEERAQELKKILAEAMQMVSLTSDQVESVEYLLNFLSTAYSISAEHSWGAAAGQFSYKLKQTYLLLHHFGYSLESKIQENEKMWKRSLSKFYDNIDDSKLERSCASGPSTLNLGQQGPLELFGEQIEFDAICNQSRLFLVRRPCGVSSNLFLSTQASGTTKWRIYSNSTGIELVPYSVLRADKKF